MKRHSPEGLGTIGIGIGVAIAIAVVIGLC